MGHDATGGHGRLAALDVFQLLRRQRLLRRIASRLLEKPEN
jgi:hypothetical protein